MLKNKWNDFESNIEREVTNKEKEYRKKIFRDVKEMVEELDKRESDASVREIELQKKEDELAAANSKLKELQHSQDMKFKGIVTHSNINTSIEVSSEGFGSKNQVYTDFKDSSSTYTESIVDLSNTNPSLALDYRLDIYKKDNTNSKKKRIHSETKKIGIKDYEIDESDDSVVKSKASNVSKSMSDKKRGQ